MSQKKKLNIPVKEYNIKIIILHIKDLRMCYYMVQKTQLSTKVFRYVDSGMKSYEQEKKGLSYCYHKRKVAANGIDTTPLDI